MKKREPASSPKTRGLTGEDIELWQHTAQSLTPLSRTKSRVRDVAGDPQAELAMSRLAKQPKSKNEPAAETKPKPSGKAPQVRTVSSPPPAPPPVADFDRRNLKKLRKGRIEIDARIDLHGMRQSEAHLALRRFLLGAHAKGKRWVLVITGKGGPSRPKSNETFGYSSEPERGVLKRNVPMWLAEPELRAIVISFSEATIEHGGAGALYVHLRKAP